MSNTKHNVPGVDYGGEELSVGDLWAARLVGRDASVQPIGVSAGLEITNSPFPDAARGSALDVIGSILAATQRGPIETLLEDNVVGPGTVTLELPNVAGVAAAGQQSYGCFPALALDVAPTGDGSIGPMSVSFEGFDAEGLAWAVDPVGMIIRSREVQKMLLIVAENGANGPRYMPGSLMTVNHPSRRDNNGAPDAAAMRTVSATIVSGPADATYTLRVVTPYTQEYYDMQFAVLAAVLGTGGEDAGRAFQVRQTPTRQAVRAAQRRLAAPVRS